jgi:hypothetical protein
MAAAKPPLEAMLPTDGDQTGPDPRRRLAIASGEHGEARARSRPQRTWQYELSSARRCEASLQWSKSYVSVASEFDLDVDAGG